MTQLIRLQLYRKCSKICSKWTSKVDEFQVLDKKILLLIKNRFRSYDKKCPTESDARVQFLVHFRISHVTHMNAACGPLEFLFETKDHVTSSCSNFDFGPVRTNQIGPKAQFRTVCQSRDHKLFEPRFWSTFVFFEVDQKNFNSLKVDQKLNSITWSFISKRTSGERNASRDYLFLILNWSKNWTQCRSYDIKMSNREGRWS